jgi:uncharacterized protein
MRDPSKETLLGELRAMEPRLKSRGLTAMTLFGSRARGDNRPDSDVDLAIEVDPAVKFSLIDFSGVSVEIQERLDVEANLFMQRSLEPAFVRELARDGIRVF